MNDEAAIMQLKIELLSKLIFIIFGKRFKLNIIKVKAV